MKPLEALIWLLFVLFWFSPLLLFYVAGWAAGHLRRGLVGSISHPRRALGVGFALFAAIAFGLFFTAPGGALGIIYNYLYLAAALASSLLACLWLLASLWRTPQRRSAIAIVLAVPLFIYGVAVARDLFPEEVEAHCALRQAEHSLMIYYSSYGAYPEHLNTIIHQKIYNSDPAIVIYVQCQKLWRDHWLYAINSSAYSRQGFLYERQAGNYALGYPYTPRLLPFFGPRVCQVDISGNITCGFNNWGSFPPQPVP
jgi:hypothetical protein